MRNSLFAVSLLLASTWSFAGTAATAETSGISGPDTVGANYRPQDYQVYVDKPTGLAFIKTPHGWKFIRQLEPEQVARLPKQVTTPPKPAAVAGQSRQG